jgi:hypothetical protein
MSDPNGSENVFRLLVLQADHENGERLYQALVNTEAAETEAKAETEAAKAALDVEVAVCKDRQVRIDGPVRNWGQGVDRDDDIAQIRIALALRRHNDATAAEHEATRKRAVAHEAIMVAAAGHKDRRIQ